MDSRVGKGGAGEGWDNNVQFRSRLLSSLQQQHLCFHFDDADLKQSIVDGVAKRGRTNRGSMPSPSLTAAARERNQAAVVIVVVVVVIGSSSSSRTTTIDNHLR